MRVCYALDSDSLMQSVQQGQLRELTEKREQLLASISSLRSEMDHAHDEMAVRVPCAALSGFHALIIPSQRLELKLDEAQKERPCPLVRILVLLHNVRSSSHVPDHVIRPRTQIHARAHAHTRMRARAGGDDSS